MIDEQRSKEDLINELNLLRQKVAELESGRGESFFKSAIFRSLCNHLPIGVSVCTDFNCREILHNPIAASLFRIDNRESFPCSAPEQPNVKLFSCGQLMSPEEMPIQRSLWNGERIDNQEIEFLWEDGVHKISLWKSRPIIGPQGNVTGAIAISEDITERKRAEEALRDSEEGMRLAITTARIVIWEVDLLSGKATGFETMEELFGVMPPDDMMEALIIYHPDDQVRVLEEFNLAVEKGGEYRTEWRLPTKDGDLHMQTIGKIVKDNTGRAVRAFGVIQDITERKRAEESLRESRLILETVIEQMPIGIILTDAIGMVAKNNKEMDRIWRREMHPSENINDHAYIAYHPDGREYQLNEWPLSRSISEGEVVIGEEMTFLRGDGTVGTALVNSSPILNDEGNIIAAVVADLDITDRKRAEEALWESEKRQEFLLRLYDALRPLADPVEIQLTACRILGEHIGVSRVLYGDVVDEKQVIISKDYVNGVPSIAATLDAADFSQFTIDAYKSGEFVIIDDTTTDSRLSDDERNAFKSINVAANISLGLLKEGKWVAAFGAHNSTSRVWTTEEINLMEETAERTWAAVERARAEEIVRIENSITVGINRILHEALLCRDEEELGKTCLNIALEVTGSTIGFIGEIHPEGFLDHIAINAIGWDACRMPYSDPSKRPNVLKIQGIYGRVIQDSRALYTNNPASHPDRIGLPEGHPSLTSFIGAPLLENGLVIGMIGLGNNTSGYSDNDLYILEKLTPSIVQVLMLKRAKIALEERGNFYDMLFDAMNLGFFIIDLIFDENDKPIDMFYVEANAAAIQMVGTDFSGKRLREIDPNYEEYWYEIFGRVALTGQSIRMEQWAEPDRKWYNFFLFKIGGESSRRIGNIFLDITARKQAEKELQDYKLHLEELVQKRTSEVEDAVRQKLDVLESISDCFYSLGRDLRFTYVNKGAENAWGLSRDELIGKKIEEIFSGAIDISLGKFRQVLKKKIPQHYELFSNVTKSWVYMSVYPTTEGISVFWQDITLLKQSEEELIKSNQKIRDILESISDAFYSVEADWRITYVNSKTAELWRYSQEELAGKILWDIWPGQEQLKGYQELHRAMRERIHINFETYSPNINLWVNTNVYPTGDGGVSVYLLDITERKKMEEALLQSEREKSTILESITDMFVAYDNEWRVTYWNAAAEKMFNLPSEDILGRNFWEVFPNSVGTEFYKQYHYAMKEKKAVAFEAFGSYSNRWIEARVYPSEDGFSLYLQDITRRKQAEEALRQSEERFRKSFHDSPILASIIDVETGLFLNVNKAWLKVLGYEREEIVGKYAHSFDNDQVNLNRRLQVMESIKFRDNGITTEGILITKNGERRTGIFTSGLIEVDGKPCVLNQIVDITERKRAEEELRQSEERFAKAFHSSPLMMAIINNDNDRFIEINQVYLDTIEYSREEVIGHTSLELNLFPIKGTLDQRLDELKEQNSLHEREQILRTKSGKIKTILGSVEIIHINGIGCRLVVAQDISEKKAMETSIARLDRLNLIGEMAASIGHEIRNPMTSIRGFLQMLSGKDEYVEDLTFFDLMIEELDRANDIISEYLGMAKDKRVDLQAQYLDEVVKSLYPMIQADANYQEMDVRLNLGKPPMPLIDANEIRQLILNMARNGMEAMSPGGILTIGTTMEGNEIILFIKDQGLGLDPELKDKLGTPFFTTKDKGTGLGLAICYSIAARHNARIDYETGPLGTTFYVRFPVPVEQTLF